MIRNTLSCKGLESCAEQDICGAHILDDILLGIANVVAVHGETITSPAVGESTIIAFSARNKTGPH